MKSGNKSLHANHDKIKIFIANYYKNKWKGIDEEGLPSLLIIMTKTTVNYKNSAHIFGGKQRRGKRGQFL